MPDCAVSKNGLTNSNLAAVGANARGRNQQFPCCVRSPRISVGARRLPPDHACPAPWIPVLKDTAPTRVGMDRAGIALPTKLSRSPERPYLHRLCAVGVIPVHAPSLPLTEAAVLF